MITALFIITGIAWFIAHVYEWDLLLYLAIEAFVCLLLFLFLKQWLSELGLAVLLFICYAFIAVITIDSMK